MNTFTIEKKNHVLVSCAEEIPADPKGIVIAIHGFTSSKESPTCQLLLKRLPAAGYGVIAIDLPGHGTGESAKETLRIPGALDSIEAAESCARRRWPGCAIFYFGSSFGAYLTGLYISTREHAGRKAFFRSAAVNMPSLFVPEEPTEKEKQQMEDLREKGYFDTDMDLHAPVRITQDMFDDLMQTDLFAVFDPHRFGEHSVAMAHGMEDDVIDPEEAGRFSEKFGIPVTWFPAEGHSLCDGPGTPDKVVDLAIALYDTGKTVSERKESNHVSSDL